MIKIKINKNDEGQRIDRFLLKYMDKAPKGFIQKMIRKKRIKLNSKRAYPNDILKLNDEINLYLSKDTIEKFKSEISEVKSNIKLDILYEDDNIILINKNKGDISHSDKEDEKSISNALINYLIEKNEYNPQTEKSFTPAISNRLDRNTSGIIIASKNHKTLKAINKAIKEQKVDKYYKALVYGNIEREMILEDYLIKENKENKVKVSKEETFNSKKIITKIKPLKSSEDYTLLEIELITGRTHQIRAHLNYINHPIIGDKKYFKVKNKDFNLNSQFLVAYKIKFNDLEEDLKYLNNKVFEIPLSNEYKEIINHIFNN